MQLFLFVLSACALALVSANHHNSSPQAAKEQKKGPTVVACLIKLKACSKSAAHSQQRNCLRQFKACTKQHQKFMVLASIGGQKGLLTTYLQCLWSKSKEMKSCITDYLNKVMSAEKVEKFQACTTQALLCYSTWEGTDMAKKPEACKTTLKSCLNHIEEAPKGHEKAFPCFKRENGKKVGNHKFVECLGEKKLLVGQPKAIYCARKAYAGAKTCNETCQQSYQSCLYDGRQPVVNRFQNHHVNFNQNNRFRNRHVNVNHGNHARVNPGYINRQGNTGNPGYINRQGNTGNPGGYAQGSQSTYYGKSQQGVHQKQNHGTGQQG